MINVVPHISLTIFVQYISLTIYYKEKYEYSVHNEFKAVRKLREVSDYR